MKNSSHVSSNPYLSFNEICNGVQALKDYIANSEAIRASKKGSKKDLLEDDDKAKIIIEVVFKNVPSNRRTFIHTIDLPNHWRMQLEPEESNIALFVRHKKPNSEVQEIQFKRDRDLDIRNTHDYYKQLFRENLDDNMRQRISKIISVKEVATEYNTFEKMESLAKSYDLFLADRILLSNKLNPLPRRLGRRFWVKEKKVPLMIRLNEPQTLKEKFERVMRTEPFYVLGRSATEQIQVGIIRQSNKEIAENIVSFLVKLNNLYGDKIRLLRLRSTYGISLPVYADLSPMCPKVVVNSKRKRGQKTYVSDFDLLPENKKVVIEPDSTVRVMTIRK